MSPTSPRLTGVLPDFLLREAISRGEITGHIPDRNVQPASLDLQLGAVAYPLRCSFLPHGSKVAERIGDVQLGDPIDLSRGAVLYAKQAYLVPLIEGLALPAGVSGRTNPKSTTGRLDVFTRVIVDEGSRFDEIVEGYKGPMYVEVVPQTFHVRVKTGLSLNQLRLIRGDTACSGEDLRKVHASEVIWYPGSGFLTPRELPFGDGVYLTVDLSGGGTVAYKAKPHGPPIDLSKIGYYYFKDYWEPIAADRRLRIVLEKDAFYLLVSAERVRIPMTLAAEMAPYDAYTGELRTHYAGFFDPGFGYGRTGTIQGSRAVLEVRARDVPFMLEHGQRICRLDFEWMYRQPKQAYGGRRMGSSYQEQGLNLSKQFRLDMPEKPGLGFIDPE